MIFIIHFIKYNFFLELDNYYTSSNLFHELRKHLTPIQVKTYLRLFIIVNYE
jgi:hypothetical protein